MPRKTNRLLLIVVVVGVALLLLLAERYGPGGVQRRGMRVMDDLRERVQPRLSADARFSDVQLTVTTHPGLRVHGEVNHAEDVEELRSIVQAVQGVPPEVKERVIWYVTVRQPAATQSSP
jgi:hypothetical protein